MQKETLDKLRRYIDLTACHYWPALEEELEEAWQEFVDAVQAEEQHQLPPQDDPRLGPRSMKRGVLLDRGQDAEGDSR